FIGGVTKIAAARANHHLNAELGFVPDRGDHSGAGCGAALKQIGAEFDALSAALLGIDGGVERIDTDFNRNGLPKGMGTSSTRVPPPQPYFSVESRCTAFLTARPLSVFNTRALAAKLFPPTFTWTSGSDWMFLSHCEVSYSAIT